MAKITNTIEKQIVDENGQVRESETTKTINWGKEPNYVKVYLEDILYLSDLPKGYNSVLWAFIKRMGYGNQLVLNAALKRMIAEEVNLSVSSVNNALTKFVKGNLLSRIDTGIYLVNPQLFGKGEWKDISKIRLSATYDLKGRTIMAEIERNEQLEKATRIGDLEFEKGAAERKKLRDEQEAVELDELQEEELSPGEHFFDDSSNDENFEVYLD